MQNCYRRQVLIMLLIELLCSLSIFAQPPPEYDVRIIGQGTATAINEAGQAVGVYLESSLYTAWVSKDGLTAEALPLPAGMTSAYARDINDAGIIVGNTSTSVYSAGEATI